MRNAKAFTLTELLVVVAIIAIMISLLLPTINALREQIVRLHCKSNLKKVHEVVVAYAGVYKGFLPCTCAFNGIEELGGLNASPQTRFYKVEALLKLGAKPEYFCCRAYDSAYQLIKDSYDSADTDAGSAKYVWKNWWTHGWGTYTFKYVQTPGYNWFMGTDNAYVNPNDQTDPDAHWGWPLSVNPNRLYNGRPFAKRTDDQGSAPIACDELIVGQSFRGFHHYNNRHAADSSGGAECLEAGGGGHTLFLNGAVYWYDWGELEAAGPGYFYRPWSSGEKAAYYFGLEPPK